MVIRGGEAGLWGYRNVAVSRGVVEELHLICLFSARLYKWIKFMFRKNKNSEKTGARARNTPFGARREALTCSLYFTHAGSCIIGLRRSLARVSEKQSIRGRGLIRSIPFQSGREALTDPSMPC